VIIAVLAAASILFSIIFLTTLDAFSQRFLKVVPALIAADTPEATPEATPETASEAAPKRAGEESFEFRLASDDTFYSVMTSLGVPPTEINKIYRKAKPVFNLSKLRKGTVLKIHTVDGRFDRMRYKLGEFDVLVINRDASGEGVYSVKMEELPWEVKTSRVAGTIMNSLYSAGIKAGANPQVIINFSDIFAWDVDFASDIRKGDTFGIYYENIYVDGDFVKTGRILGAEMLNDGRKTVAIYYEDSEGGSGYYNAKGRSLRRMLLKSPLRYRRISSYFSRRRYHPILKRYRPHHGIDYAAPTGTPVEAAGSGKVSFVGWKKGYGRFIVIKHKNSYSTAYGHLSRYKKGLKRGSKVDQGDVIGYVGSTGISTGPHLHYELRRGKRLINPLSVKPEPNKYIPEAERERFKVVREDILAKLRGASVMASTTPGAIRR
jgi:murein DD-endopeptidase MepM/ murein hydrolase activator NlpD